MQVNSVQSYQGQNCSFRNLKIKNPQKMSNEMLEALIGVKDIFADYPNASVRLKHHKRFDSIYHEGPWHYWSFPRFESSLIFDLGEKYKGESLKFNISAQRNKKNIGGMLRVWLKSLDYYIFGDTTQMKEANLINLLSQINKENISNKIKNLKQGIDDTLAECSYRKSLLEKAHS